MAEGAYVSAVCASEEVAERFQAIGVEAVEIPLRRRSAGVGARRIWRYARGADVIHAQDRRSGLWVRLGPRPRPDGLRAYTVHGLPDEYLPPPAGRRRPGVRGILAYRWLDAGLCRRADVVFVPSLTMATFLAKRLGFPREKLAVVPGGVDPPEVPVRGGSLVGTVTSLEPVKGLDVFLRAAARLSRDRPELRFAIFGTGGDLSRLDSLARALGLSGRLELPGQLPKEEAFARLAIFVLSSHMENCPMSLLEAMAAGVPAVATNVGGIPEIAANGTAQLVRAGDDQALAQAIGRLLDDPALRTRQAQSSRERVLAHYTARTSARATLGVYARLLGSP